MNEYLRPYRWPLLIAILAAWITVVPSSFQKGGVDSVFYFLTALTVAFIVQLVLTFFEKTKFVESILLGLSLTVITLFLSHLVIMPHIVDLLFGDKTWFLWQAGYRLLINMVYFGINILVPILLAAGYFLIRQNIIRT